MNWSSESAAWDRHSIQGFGGSNFTFDTIRHTNVIVLEKPPRFSSIEDADAWMEGRAAS